MIVCVCVCTALQAKGSAAEVPLIELAVITGVAAGFPGILSPTERALTLRADFTPLLYVRAQTRRSDKRACKKRKENAPSVMHLSVSWVFKNA